MIYCLASKIDNINISHKYTFGKNDITISFNEHVHNVELVQSNGNIINHYTTLRDN